MQVDANQMEEIYKTIKEGKDGKVRFFRVIFLAEKKNGKANFGNRWSSLETERATVDSLPLKLGHVPKGKDDFSSFQGLLLLVSRGVYTPLSDLSDS